MQCSQAITTTWDPQTARRHHRQVSRAIMRHIHCHHSHETKISDICDICDVCDCSDLIRSPKKSKLSFVRFSVSVSFDKTIFLRHLMHAKTGKQSNSSNYEKIGKKAKNKQNTDSLKPQNESSSVPAQFVSKKSDSFIFFVAACVCLKRLILSFYLLCLMSEIFDVIQHRRKKKRHSRHGFSQIPVNQFRMSTIITKNGHVSPKLQLPITPQTKGGEQNCCHS